MHLLNKSRGCEFSTEKDIHREKSKVHESNGTDWIAGKNFWIVFVQTKRRVQFLLLFNMKTELRWIALFETKSTHGFSFFPRAGKVWSERKLFENPWPLESPFFSRTQRKGRKVKQATKSRNSDSYYIPVIIKFHLWWWNKNRLSKEKAPKQRSFSRNRAARWFSQKRYSLRKVEKKSEKAQIKVKSVWE